MAIEPGLEFAGFIRRKLFAVPPLQQPCDFAFAVENALALYLGGMRSQHRAHQGVVEPARQDLAFDPGFRDPVQRMGETAHLRRRTGERVHAATAILMHVFGNIDQVREIAKGAHNIECLADRQIVEQRPKLVFHGRRLGRPGTAEANGCLSNRLDALEARLSGLRAQDLAEQSAQQARVLLQW